MVIGTKVAVSVVAVPATLQIVPNLLQSLNMMGIAVPAQAIPIAASEAAAQVIAATPGSGLFLNLPKSPIQLQPEEWEFLLNTTLGLAGTILAGQGQILAYAAAELINLASQTVEVIDAINERKEAIKKLKEAKIEIYAQEQLRQESILKLMHDIEILEQIAIIQEENRIEIEKERQLLEKSLANRESEIEQESQTRIEQYREGAKQDLVQYALNKLEQLKLLARELNEKVEMAERMGF